MFDQQFDGYSPMHGYDGYHTLPPADGFMDEVEQRDRPDSVDTLTWFAAWFTTGVTAALFIRLLPALQPFYWILMIIGTAGLAFGIYLNRNPRLLAIAALLIAATLAGFWDGLAYQAEQTTHQVKEVLKR